MCAMMTTALSSWFPSTALRDIYGGGPQIPPPGTAPGPVIERIVPSDCCLDLDTGRVAELPANFRAADSIEERMNGVLAWMKEQGMDAMRSGDDLLGVDMQVTNIFGDGVWNLTPAAIATQIDQIGGASAPQLRMSAGTNVTYIFRTREKGMGALQVLGPSENPPGTKIRYRLVENVLPPFSSRKYPPTTLPAGAAIRPIFRLLARANANSE